jgi:hypothetical protein
MRASMVGAWPVSYSPAETGGDHEPGACVPGGMGWGARGGARPQPRRSPALMTRDFLDMMSRNSVRLRARGHSGRQAARTGCALTVSFVVTWVRSRKPRGKETEMNRLALLIPMLLACSRTPLGLHAPSGGSPGAVGAGGNVVVPPASGGSSGNGGAGGGMGGANMGSGGIPGAGGVVGGGGTHGPSGVGGAGGGSGAPGSGGVVSSGSSGSCAGQTPSNHRPSAVQCPSQRGPGPSCADTTCSTCSSDSQCTAGVNGRCFPWEGLVGPGGCSYDECFTDSHCGSKIPCLCRSSSTDNSANVCDVAGNCAVDSDCGSCGYCSPSLQILPNQPPNVCWGLVPYYCHTVSDLCINDSDCAPLDAGPPTPLSPGYTCAYNPQDNRWECIKAVCALP